MMSDIEKYKETENNQEMTLKQKENWIEWPEIINMYNNYEKEHSHLLEKDKLTKKEFYNLQ